MIAKVKFQITSTQREELKKMYMNRNIHFVCFEKGSDFVKAYSDTSRLLEIHKKGSMLYQVMQNYPSDEVVCIKTILE